MSRRPTGACPGRFDVAPLTPGMVIGPAPKAVAWNELSLARQGGAWRCRVTIEVWRGASRVSL